MLDSSLLKWQAQFACRSRADIVVLERAVNLVKDHRIIDRGRQSPRAAVDDLLHGATRTFPERIFDGRGTALNAILTCGALRREFDVTRSVTWVLARACNDARGDICYERRIHLQAF